MILQPIRNQIVERISRVGEASVHNIGSQQEIDAHTYHFHRSLEVIIVKAGTAEGLVGEMVGELHKGMVVLLGSEVPHRVLRASHDCSLLLVHIPSEFLKWDSTRFPELSPGLELIEAGKSGLIFDDAQFAAQLSRLAGKIAAAEGFLRLSLLLRLIHELCTIKATATISIPQATTANKAAKTPIDRAFRFIYDNLTEQFSLSDVAQYAGLTESALCRAFKRTTGLTIRQLCTRLRIEYACRLLLTTDLDIAQIAYVSGFNSYPYFCAQFKAHTAQTPTLYRHKTKTEPKATIEQKIQHNESST